VVSLRQPLYGIAPVERGQKMAVKKTIKKRKRSRRKLPGIAINTVQTFAGRVVAKVQERVVKALEEENQTAAQGEEPDYAQMRREWLKKRIKRSLRKLSK
jgi:hypothetical protein